MKKFILAFVAVFALSLVSCGGGSENKEAAGDTQQAVEQKAEETQKAAEETQEATEQKAEETQEAAQAQASGKDGKTLTLENGCTACHKETEKSVGPSYKDVAAAYAGKEDQLFNFLKGKGKAIVDPAQFSVMQPNLEITKKMADDDVKAIVKYIISLK